MDEYTASTYGDRIAGVYDDMYESIDVEHAVAFLAGQTRGGKALELGIGTGRIALPLAGRGVEVHGIDASEAMVAGMRAKPGGDSIPVTIGDFATLSMEEKFSLIFVVFNTFYGLLSQEDQVSCFRSVSERLTGDGVFVIDAFVPDMTRFERGQATTVNRVETDRVILDVTQHDPVNQRVTSQHVELSERGVRLYPVQLRYAWPSEMDLMARLAGLRLRDRWGGWNMEPFTTASGKHVSVYVRD